MKRLLCILLIAISPGCASGLDCSDLYATKKPKPVKEGQNPTKTLTGAELNAVNLRLKELCEALQDVIDTQGSTGGGVYPVPPPSITSCTPLEGGVGAEIVCSGSGLATMTSFKVNGTEAATRQVLSDGMVKGTVATGTTSGTIVITTTVAPPASGGTFTVNSAPGVPRNLTLTASDFPAVGLTWDPPLTGSITAYQTERTLDVAGVPGAWCCTSQGNPTPPSYTVSTNVANPALGIENGKTYWFRVRAMTGTVAGPWTEPKSIYVPLKPAPAVSSVYLSDLTLAPGACAQVNATIGNGTATDLHWRVSAGAVTTPPEATNGAYGTVSETGYYCAPSNAPAGTSSWARVWAIAKADAAVYDYNLVSTPPASGETFYVTVSGSGTTCSQAAPCGSVATGISKLGPGDTLNIGAGTYTTPQSGSYFVNLPVTLKGTAAERIVIQGAGKGQTIFRPTTTNHVIYSTSQNVALALNHDPVNCPLGRCAENVAQYITFRDFTIDAVNAINGVKLEFAASDTDKIHSAHHLRFENVEIKNARMQGILTYGDHSDFVNMDIHDNGQTSSPQTHGIYMAGKKNTVSGGSIYRNMCQGIQMWSGYGSHEPSDNTVDGVTIQSNGSNSYGNCGSADKSGVGMYCGVRNKVQNCVLDNNRGPGVLTDSGAWGNQIVNNLVSYNNSVDGTAGILISTAMHTGCDAGTTHEPLDPDVPGAARAVATNTVVNSNVLWGNGTGGDTAPGNQIKDDGINTDLDPANTAGPPAP